MARCIFFGTPCKAQYPFLCHGKYIEMERTSIERLEIDTKINYGVLRADF